MKGARPLPVGLIGQYGIPDLDFRGVDLNGEAENFVHVCNVASCSPNDRSAVRMKVMKVILSIGIPGCGKTTALKPLAENLGYTYISRDNIRMELTGDPTDHTMEPEVGRITYERLEEALQYGGVVLDGTLAKRADRIQTVMHCRELGATEITALWFKVPFEECVRRNASRDRQVPEAILKRMQTMLDTTPPTMDEGYDNLAVVQGA